MDYDEVYAGHEEKKGDIFNRLKDINPIYLGIFLLLSIVGVSYYASKNNKEVFWVVIGILVVVGFIFIYGSSKKKEGTTWEEAKAILRKYINDDLQSVEGDLPRGRAIITNKGKPIPYESFPYYIIYFYIVDAENGIETWFRGRVKTTDGNFGGWERVEGDTSGRFTVEHGTGGAYGF